MKELAVKTAWKGEVMKKFYTEPEAEVIEMDASVATELTLSPDNTTGDSIGIDDLLDP